MADTRDGVVEVGNGRCVSWKEQGPRDGLPLVFLPGAGDSRLALHPDSAIAERAGIHVVALDRPGYGWSSAAPGHSVSDFALDVQACADRLGIREQFVTAGWSAGAPYALACAALLRRVVGAVIVSPAIPVRWIDRAAIASTADRIAVDRNGYLDSAQASWTGADAELLKDQAIAEMWSRQTREALRQGPTGLADDLEAVFVHDWGFQLREVTCVTVTLHGDDDTVFPRADVAAWAAGLPGCRPTYCPAPATDSSTPLPAGTGSCRKPGTCISAPRRPPS